MTDKQRQQISAESKGKIIESMEWDDKDKYWVITFTDSSEMCVRLMADIVMAAAAASWPTPIYNRQP